MNVIFNEILHMSVDASILVVAVIIVRLFMQKSPKYFRKILWGLVGLRLLFPFSLQSIFSLVPERVNTVTQDVARQVTVAGVQKGEFSALMLFPYIWVAVLAVLIIYGAVSFVRLKLKISDAVLDKENIYLSEKVESPFVCGFVKPKIYLSYGIEDNTKEYILHHERTHIKYADHILKSMGFVLVCVYWFNPLVWVSYFLFCKDIELACDEAVIKDYNEDARKKYAKAIFDIGVNKVKLSACPVAFGEVGIKERVKSALNYKKVKRVFVVVSVAVCVAVALCFMTEPKAEAAKSENKPVAEEPTTEPVTEPTIQAVTEPSTEPTAEPVTEEPTTETVSSEFAVETLVTQSVLEDSNDLQNENNFDEIVVIEPPIRYEPMVTTSPYVIVTKPTVNTPDIEYPSIPPLFDEPDLPDPYANTPSPYKEFNYWHNQ